MSTRSVGDAAPKGKPQSLIPREVAERYRVSVDKVVGWIRVGKLRAFNVGDGLKRPRWRVLPADLTAFETERMATPPPKPARRRRRDPAIKDYFSGA